MNPDQNRRVDREPAENAHSDDAIAGAEPNVLARHATPPSPNSPPSSARRSLNAGWRGCVRPS